MSYLYEMRELKYLQSDLDKKKKKSEYVGPWWDAAYVFERKPLRTS